MDPFFRALIRHSFKERVSHSSPLRGRREALARSNANDGRDRLQLEAIRYIVKLV